MNDQCAALDPVWDRRCQKHVGHIVSILASQRLHENDEPGDRLRWGSAKDMREVEHGNRTIAGALVQRSLAQQTEN